MPGPEPPDIDTRGSLCTFANNNSRYKLQGFIQGSGILCLYLLGRDAIGCSGIFNYAFRSSGNDNLSQPVCSTLFGYLIRLRTTLAAYSHGDTQPYAQYTFHCSPHKSCCFLIEGHFS